MEEQFVCIIHPICCTETTGKGSILQKGRGGGGVGLIHAFGEDRWDFIMGGPGEGEWGKRKKL